MIEIYEAQHVEGNKKSLQSRKIEFPNWDDYIVALQTIDGIGKAMPFYPTLPRQIKARIIELNEKQVRYEYYNQVLGLIVNGKSIWLDKEANKS